MILKDDELLIIGIIKEQKIEGKIALKDVRSVFYDLIQVGPMYKTFQEQLETQEIIPRMTRKLGDSQSLELTTIDRIDLSYKTVFEVLNSPQYLSDVPRVS